MFLSGFRDDVDLIVCVEGTEVWHFSDLGQSCAIPDACTQELVLGQAHRLTLKVNLESHFSVTHCYTENVFKHIKA